MTDEKKLTWWQLMYKNAYVQLFALAIAFLVVMLICKDEFYTEGGFYIGISIPIGMMVMISILGFYKFWKEYSKTTKK